jgi:hypothetical protein
VNASESLLGVPIAETTEIFGRAHALDVETASGRRVIVKRLRADDTTGVGGPVLLDASYLLAPFPSCWCLRDGAGRST